MLDLDPSRALAVPRDAATLLLLRDSPDGPEIFCVERNKASRFMGGALVFPGGKVDAADGDEALALRTRGLPLARQGFADTDAHLRALAVAALRESLEEAAILPVAGGIHADLLALRAELTGGFGGFGALLERAGLTLDLAELHPFARWVTPETEARRFDARFFVCRAPDGQPGAHDEGETTASFWATPRAVLERFANDEVRLAPPTHRCLELFAELPSVDAAFALATRADLRPICPALVGQQEGAETLFALTLPGDPEHPLAEPRVPGRSRYVNRAGKFVPEDAPATAQRRAP
ncbi:MAG: hypothetical protein IPF92_17880 [Myxococcales bacterium]|nr:hypothetical protein [Myxococcales bacterium]